MLFAPQSISLEAALRDLRDPGLEVRLRAAHALGGLAALDPGADRAAKALLVCLRAAEPALRAAAARALGELQSTSAAEALRECALRDDSDRVRASAVRALGHLADAANGPTLREALDDPEPTVRSELPAALASTLGQGASPQLRALLGDRDPDVRATAAAAAGDIGSKALCDALAARLDDAAADVQLEAALALVRLRDSRGVDPLGRAVCDRRSALAAARTLFGSDVEQLAQLRPQLDAAVSRWFGAPVAKVWIAGCLARLGDRPAAELLGQQLHSRNDAVCGSAIEVLGALGSPWAQQQLAQFATSRRGHRWRQELSAALERTAAV